MRLGTKILILMLLITLGSAAAVAWIVTFNVASYETRRANEQISLAIKRYINHLDDRHHQIDKVVRALLEAPVQRSQLQAADDPADTASREQLKQEVFGRNVQIELSGHEGSPAFHVLVNQANEIIVSLASAGPALEKTLASEKLHWPVEPVLMFPDRLTRHYVSTPQGLFLAMGVPLRTQLNESPTHAYFVGFRVDDDWTSRQLLADRIAMAAESADAPLCAFFVIDDKVVARASSSASDNRIHAFTPSLLPPQRKSTATTSSSSRVADPIEFGLENEHFLGQSFDLHPAGATSGQVVLASSLDEALIPLHRLQRQILLTALFACLIAIIACRVLARSIARPIVELVAGTQRIAAGQFDSPVDVRRRDELGKLSHHFNQMAQGLKERDVLRDEHTKIQRDLAVARKIQMDILPKHLPACPGYSLAASSIPAEQTGGDIYDVVAVALEDVTPGSSSTTPGESWGEDTVDGRPDPRKSPLILPTTPLVLLLADATGHGLGPAISVTQVRAMLRIGVRLRADLDDVFSQINRQLCQDLGSGRFVTAFLGLLDPSSHRVDYHSAGQGPLMHYHAASDTIQWLDSSMMPLGIYEDAEDSGSQRMQIASSDCVVLLTDGFYEYQNPQGEMFGRDRIAAIIRANYTRSAREILAELMAATQAFAHGAPQLDDMTALIIKRLPV